MDYSPHIEYLNNSLQRIAKAIEEHNRIQRLVHNIYDETTQTMIVPKDDPPKENNSSLSPSIK
jgi:hypothetical protein